MEELKYIIEDKTIAELLGIQNFNNDESAILELVKNSYDAKCSKVCLTFLNDTIIILDDGIGMTKSTILTSWMHVGKSLKDYFIIDNNGNKRILSGSKGIGRFALARLGEVVKVYTKSKNQDELLWETDWNSSFLKTSNMLKDNGTMAIISVLRQKWTKKKIANLIDFLEKTYNDTSMEIEIIFDNEKIKVNKYFCNPVLGKNCKSYFIVKYNEKDYTLTIDIKCDEFTEEAVNICKNINIKEEKYSLNIYDTLRKSKDYSLDDDELGEKLTQLGNFYGEFYFNVTSSKYDMEKFLYKYDSVNEAPTSGIILYRNAFSISSYEGKKDWLGLGKRSRKSPAAASHPTGAWRVRENQLSGKVVIDKVTNKNLKDLSNRQGLDEDLYFQLFISILHEGIKEFERYRQKIIRQIDNNFREDEKEKNKPISDLIVKNYKNIFALSDTEAQQLVIELSEFKEDEKNIKNEKINTEKRYKYDVRILNVLATSGLKATSIAHELKNDRSYIETFTNDVIEALKKHGVWEILNSDEKREVSYLDVPGLIENNNITMQKILVFMNTMLNVIEKNKFKKKLNSVADIVENIKMIWERDYSWVRIRIDIPTAMNFMISEDIIRVILDNLILNSIQQNNELREIFISIGVSVKNDVLYFKYFDTGVGLDNKYKDNPFKILDVHESTREDGHGLGMWIVNNTVNMSGGEIKNIEGSKGFSIEFTLGDNE